MTGLNEFEEKLVQREEVEMQKRRLGNSGLEVAPLALGGNVFGWTVAEADAFRILDAAFEAGLTFSPG